MFERRERAAQRILGPALWIALDRIREETVEGRQQIGSHFREREFADEIGGLGNNEVVAMIESFSQRPDRGGGRPLAKRIERG